MSADFTRALARRHRADRRFALYGKLAVAFALCMLLLMLMALVRPGLSGFTRHEITLEIIPSMQALPKDIAGQMQQSTEVLHAALRRISPDVAGDKATRRMLSLVGTFAVHDVRRALLQHHGVKPILLQVPLSDAADMALKGKRVHIASQHLLQHWQREGKISRQLSADFFGSGDSRSPESAGFFGSILGSILSLLVCMAVAFPVAVMAGVYLEEFARKNRFTAALEIAINNLAAVPSIIYGLLGLSVLLNVFGLPRSSALVGGLTLAMLVLPVMIIATRASLRAVPPSMREAAYGLGSSPLQVVWHHVLPYAMPGMMTGAILSMARAIGETAPLLMIGMVAFVADVPRGLTDATTSMPVQIYVWASSPEMGFAEKTASGILVLLLVLSVLNATAIFLRRRFEKQW